MGAWTIVQMTSLPLLGGVGRRSPSAWRPMAPLDVLPVVGVVRAAVQLHQLVVRYLQQPPQAPPSSEISRHRRENAPESKSMHRRRILPVRFAFLTGKKNKAVNLVAFGVIPDGSKRGAVTPNPPRCGGAPVRWSGVVLRRDLHHCGPDVIRHRTRLQPRPKAAQHCHKGRGPDQPPPPGSSKLNRSPIQPIFTF